MDIKKHLEIEKNLFQFIGEEKVKKMTGEISEIIRTNNLDVTPITLNDFLTYVKEIIFLAVI